MELAPIDFDSPQNIAAITAAWNAASAPELRICDATTYYNTRPNAGGVQAGWFGQVGDRPAGFVLASSLPGDPVAAPPGLGWIDALVVLPDFQQIGVGSALLRHAEHWLAEQGCRRVLPGGSIRPFAAGVLVELGTEPFFARHGYAPATRGGRAWDVACDLRGYTSRYAGRAWPEGVHAAPARPGDEEVLLEYLRRSFPGRWRYEAEEFLRSGGAITDFVLLWTPERVEGSCHLTFEDSIRPMDRFFPARLARPYGQLGSIGISEPHRGKGYGGLLLDTGLCYLAERGVAGCVIDWTGLLDFYGKFGFRPYRQYAMLAKTIGED
jgi:GNAT superfamily N-acetyltransferase